MYIMDKYWNNYIGDTDDSMTLIDYFVYKNREEISLAEIFQDIGLNKLNWKFQQTEVELGFQNKSGLELSFYYAIDLVTDLAAILLECKKNGSVLLSELCGYDLNSKTDNIRITATSEEYERIGISLAEFVAEPLTYDLSEMCSETEILEMAEVCENLRNELVN